MLSFRKAFRDIANWVKGVDDYVVKQKTSGIWRYRIWKSGLTECWGIKTYTVPTNTAVNIPAFDFPVTFKSPPTVNVGTIAGGASYYRAHCLYNYVTTTSMRLTLVNQYTGGSARVDSAIYVVGILGGVTNLLQVLCGRRWSYA